MFVFQKASAVRFSFPVVLFLAGGIASSFAQLRTDNRLDQKFNSRSFSVGGERGVSTKEGLDISFVTSLAYDSNILQTTDDEVSSLVGQFEPTIGWTAGERDKNWIRLAYEGTGILFFNSTEDNRIDNRLIAEGGFKGKNLALAYSGRWARLGSPSADLGGESDRDEWGVSATVTYSPGGKLSYEAFGERSAVDQLASSGFDFFQSSGGVSARYRYSSKTEVELAYRLGQVEVDGSGTQIFQQVGLRAEWSPRSKINVSIEAGVDIRDYEVGNGVEPYLSARVDWRPRAKTALFLEAYRRVEASAGVVGENLNLTGVRFGVNQRLQGRWSAGLELGWENSDYFGIAGFAESGREDNILFVRPSLRYSLGDSSELVFLYQWSQNDSTEADFGFEGHRLGASLNYFF